VKKHLKVAPMVIDTKKAKTLKALSTMKMCVKIRFSITMRIGSVIRVTPAQTATAMLGQTRPLPYQMLI
jgi:hypothetical protein